MGRAGRILLVAVVAAATVMSAGAVTLTAPARATAAPPPPPSPNVHGYVWGDQRVNPFYQPAVAYNSTGGVVEITRTLVGEYTVRFAGLATSHIHRGVAHVVAQHPTDSGWCTLVDFYASGADEVLKVRCYEYNGASGDQRFMATFTNTHTPVGQVSYFTADQPTQPDPYKPIATRRYDSTGTATTVDRYATGSYKIDSAAITAAYPFSDDGQFQVTPLTDQPRHCEVRVDQVPVKVPVTVICREASGVLVDSAFTFSYVRGTDLLAGGLASSTQLVRLSKLGVWYKEGWWSSDGFEPSVTRIGPGHYWMRFEHLGGDVGVAMPQSVALSAAASYCDVGAPGWTLSGDQLVEVRCYDQFTHQPTDPMISVSYLTA